MRNLSEQSRQIHREIVRLTVLVAIVVVAFVFTRTAGHATTMSHREDASSWYAMATRAGQTDADRVTALRKAVVNDPDNREYRLALASTLDTRGDTSMAVRILTDLERDAPEDSRTNLTLARLEARRNNVDASRRYYQRVLSALWMPAAVEQRRAVRLELVDLLLANQQTARALTELLTLTTEIPDEPDSHINVGQRLLGAGDAAQAREQFLMALGEQPTRDEALAGAGVSSFALGDYASASRYLAAAPRNAGNDELLDIAQQILALDPLERRIGSQERRRRVTTLLNQSAHRLDTCLAATPPPADSALLALRPAVEALRTRVSRRSDDARDTSEDGIELAYRIETAVDRTCVPSSLPADRAVRLIARRHQVPPG